MGSNNVDIAIEHKREHEKEKYLWLRKAFPKYGSSNHGKNAYNIVLNFSPLTVIDLGCGDNSFLKKISKNNIETIGVDFVHEKADILRPMHDTGIKSNTANVVTAFDALEHLIPEEIDEVLKEMYRITKPKGHFVFSISTRKSEYTVKGGNLHPTVQPIEWWIEKIERYGTILEFSPNKYLVGYWR